ncbi:hypothetical protein [Saccharothrix sp. NRRL B-16314]|uniref:hypothetical protein n=1 Tax=Saccharothrix sp. NRRL B-16314 TaxID=1463825 RepID=UPI000A664D27|nr:hypothetical protein [Saccharothrix sp. NRRL B-16314]
MDSRNRFQYRGHHHHRIDHVYLATTTTPRLPLKSTDNEKQGLIERRWRTLDDLIHSTDKLLPAQLPNLLRQILHGNLPTDPLILHD